MCAPIWWILSPTGSFASGWTEPSAHYGERLRSLVYYKVKNTAYRRVEKYCICGFRYAKNRLATNDTAISTVSDRRFFYITKKQKDAIAPNRRQMAPSSRPRTISCGLGRNKIGEQSDLHRLYPKSIPLIKVLARLGEIFDFS